MCPCGVAAITVMELNGVTHNLGSFTPKDKVEQVFLSAADAMRVPVEALQFVLDGKHVVLENSEVQLCDLAFTTDMQLLALMQMPVDVNTDLASMDYRHRIRAYTKLADLACRFEGQGHTHATVNLLKQVIALVVEGLTRNTYPLVREAVVEALAKLSRYSQTLCQHDAKVANMMPEIAEAFGGLLQSRSWIERQLACVELGLLGNAAASEIASLCDCCLDTGNISVRVEAYKSLTQLLENGLSVPPHQLDHITEILACGLEAPYPIGEWACRGIACLGNAATPYVTKLCELVVQEFDRHTQRAAAYALSRLSEVGVDI